MAVFFQQTLTGELPALFHIQYVLPVYFVTVYLLTPGEDVGIKFELLDFFLVDAVCVTLVTFLGRSNVEKQLEDNTSEHQNTSMEF